MEIIISREIDNDRRLLKFETYEEYLDSLVTPMDLCYLQSTSTARQLARLGYRNTGKTYDENTFYRRRNVVKNLLYSKCKPYVLSSELITLKDKLQHELAFRERGNRLHILSTIIFMRHLNKHCFEVSAYIDFAHRLETENWIPFFEGKRKLCPLKTDLSYYHWRMGKAILNKTFNYLPIIDLKQGLVFQNLHDGKIIKLDPLASNVNTTQIRIYCDGYENIILYDYVLRGKMQL